MVEYCCAWWAIGVFFVYRCWNKCVTEWSGPNIRIERGERRRKLQKEREVGSTGWQWMLMFDKSDVGYCKQGSQRNLETWKAWRFEFYLSSSRNTWNLSQKVWNLDKTTNLAENLDKIWNVNRYKISILYWDNFFHVLYSCKFRIPLVSAFWCQNWSHYNLENDLLDLNKTWG